MHTLAFVASKGGVGKTTLAAHIAVEAEQAGRTVAMIDLDPQGSLSEWFKVREADTPPLAIATTDTLPAVLKRLADLGTDLTVIDTPPGHSGALIAAVRSANMAAIPCLPSALDIRAIGPTVQLVKDAGKPFTFVLNRADYRQRNTTQSALLLSQHGRAAPEPVRYLADYSAAMTDGRTAQELSDRTAAARNIAALWTYLDDRLEGVAP